MVKYDGSDWVFSSGRKRYGFTEQLSIELENGQPRIGYGSDGEFWRGFSEWDGDPKLTKDDLKELAELQVQRWQQFIEWLSHQEGQSET